jgi:polysaccharide chain length determinant protein (PEP-CTERM system associated)
MPPRQQRNEAAFNLSDLIRIVRRRFLWFAVPAALGLMVAAGVALGLPPIYEAETKILIEAQGIPQRLVETTVVQDKETRFNNISVLILARDNLASIINEFDLYSEENAPMEQRVQMMRDDITIEPILPRIVDPRRPVEVNSLRIAYRGKEPKLIADVANQLARDFIRENLESRAEDAEGTSEFLEAELGRATQELNRIAHDITDFKEQHLGELPEQLAENRRRLERLSNELSIKQAELETARNQTSMIRAQLHDLRMANATGDDNPLKRRQAYAAQLSSFLARGFTEKHPDVIRTRAELAQLDQQLSAAEEDDPVRAPTREETALMGELRHYEVTLQVMAEDTERIAEDIAKYEARIENTPRHAARLAHLESSYQTQQSSIRELQTKKMLADIARAMEVKQKGEKFRVIESAVPPHFPVRPNRPLIFVVGAILGLMAGVALMVVRELTDSRLHTLAELQAGLPLPILGTVPVIRLPSEIAEARARIRRLGLSAAAAVVLIATVGAGAYFYLSGDSERIVSVPSQLDEEAGDV